MRVPCCRLCTSVLRQAPCCCLHMCMSVHKHVCMRKWRRETHTACVCSCEREHMLVHACARAWGGASLPQLVHGPKKLGDRCFKISESLSGSSWYISSRMSWNPIHCILSNLWYDFYNSSINVLAKRLAKVWQFDFPQCLLDKSWSQLSISSPVIRLGTQVTRLLSPHSKQNALSFFFNVEVAGSAA